MSKFSLNDKVAIVTGGASGIGKSIVEVFAQQGAYVYILDINLASAKQLAQDLSETGAQVKAYKLDLTKQNQVIKRFQKIQDTHPIDILVNNAGIGFVGNLEATTEADINRIYNVNIKGVYNCLYACVPLMKRNGGGVILNMASVVSSVGIADRFAYSMSKGAVLTMTLSIAKDYIHDNIRCNSISPARVHTPFIDAYLKKNYPGKEKKIYKELEKTQPIGRMARPEEIANLALYLCSDEAAFITGTDYPIDGGFIKLNN